MCHPVLSSLKEGTDRVRAPEELSLGCRCRRLDVASMANVRIQVRETQEDTDFWEARVKLEQRPDSMEGVMEARWEDLEDIQVLRAQPRNTSGSIHPAPT